MILIPALCLASAAGHISAVFDPQTAAFSKAMPAQRAAIVAVRARSHSLEGVHMK